MSELPAGSICILLEGLVEIVKDSTWLHEGHVDDLTYVLRY